MVNKEIKIITMKAVVANIILEEFNNNFENKSSFDIGEVTDKIVEYIESTT